MKIIDLPLIAAKMAETIGWFKKVNVKISWPLPETDYDGEDLWAMRLPKPTAMEKSFDLLNFGMQGISQEAICAGYMQTMAANQLQAVHGPYFIAYPQWGCSPIGSLLRPFGL